MSKYVFLPDYDGDWSIMREDEYEATGGEGEYGRAITAELAFSLDGSRGHYLQAAFILEALAELPDIVPCGMSMPMQDAEATAHVYFQHEGRHDGECESCDNITDDADRVEAILGEFGYVVDWEDGVSVFKVEGRS